MTRRPAHVLATLLLALGVSFGALAPSVTHAAGLGSAQVAAILNLLRAFGTDSSVIAGVAAALGGSAPANTDPAPASSTQATPTTPAYVRPPIIGSPYPSSSIGYDISFNTKDYPQMPFGFAVVGVTAGKAFTHNTRLASEFSWARVAAAAAPTIYLNLNAPYGSSASGDNVSGPQACTHPFGTPVYSASAGGTYPDPAPCAGYNYGYNAAKDAYAYASSLPYVSATFWWLDIEEANSWAPDTAVNDEVIQGAIDYLNSKDIRVGLYSVPYMWKNIAGTGFTPTESLTGSGPLVPTWFPIGISTQVGAINACLDHASFIPGSPVWIIQYERNSTAVDQNVAC
jgi:hypothetical protein